MLGINYVDLIAITDLDRWVTKLVICSWFRQDTFYDVPHSYSLSISEIAEPTSRYHVHVMLGLIVYIK